jgi:dihydrofolate reductase
MKISIIAAMDSKRGLGKENKLLFKIPEDFARMQKLTMGHPIIMGRKTFASIGRALPNRYNIVITRDLGFKINDLRESNEFIVVSSLDEALMKAEERIKMPQDTRYEIQDTDEVFVFGGGQIYQQAISKADRLYLTLVEGDFNADTFFPDYSQFTKVISQEDRDENGFKYKFLTLEK